MSPIAYHVEDISFTLPHNIDHITTWLIEVAAAYDIVIEQLTYIFCSDPYLLLVNKQFLGHDYYTDVITFPYEAESNNHISGDVFISVDRVTDNANQYKVSVEEELYRVMAHGLLHLLGFSDKTLDKQKQMRKQEDLALLTAPHVSRET